MASSRNIRAPGIELREIDRSQYTLQDNSLPNAPAVFMTGFADSGESYSIKWINSINTLIKTYGKPMSEFEQLFHSACIEILNRGGICLAAKLPYDNHESKTYTYCDFEVSKEIKSITSLPDTDSLKILNDLDVNLTSYIEINSTSSSGKMPIKEFDDLLIGKSPLQRNGKGIIRIVDVSKSRLKKSNFNCVYKNNDDGTKKWTNECLGIFPVIVTAPNAIYWQHLMSDNSKAAKVEDFNTITSLTCINPQDISEHIDLSQLPSNMLCQMSSDDKNDETMSKMTAQLFPLVSFANAQHFKTQHLKNVCVVVVQAYADPANNNLVNFQILESFIGSLDRKAKKDNGASFFIDDIVNNSSQYINLFSNVDQKLFDRISTIVSRGNTGTMLGFFNDDCVKKIDVTESIINPLARILDSVKDPNRFQFDILIDAGVSNIAQYVEDRNQVIAIDKRDAECLSFTQQGFEWVFKNEEARKWNVVLKQFDNFCKFTRKDCMFIADGLRTFCIEGNQKIVRKTHIGSNIRNDILPKLKYMTGLNSSFSAGYCDWFQMNEYHTGDLIWCPPSIKAASICIYCDTYFHPWDAPAGMVRGIVPNVVDVAFSPTNEEAGYIYDQCWNYSINYPIDGIIMEGQKTFQTNKTALDRINVRRLLLNLEKKVIRVAKYFLYEGNTEYHRQKFVDTIRPIFENAVRGSGILEYAIRCDETLNTPQVIDNNELRCKIAIKPVKTIEFIVIDLITTNQSASVSEEVLK